MFETTEVILQMIGIYIAAGFALGILYNIFRFIRRVAPHHKLLAVMLDIIFCLISGAVLFILSAAYGMGYFRLYYVFAAAVGFAANMMTLGFIIPPLARLFRRIFLGLYRILSKNITQLISLICQKINSIFIKISENITKIIEKCKNHLKKHRKVVYNNNDHKIGKVYKKEGEHRNAIKAKVRKIG